MPEGKRFLPLRKGRVFFLRLAREGAARVASSPRGRGGQICKVKGVVRSASSGHPRKTAFQKKRWS